MSFKQALAARDVAGFLELLKRGQRPSYFILNDMSRNMKDPSIRQMMKDAISYRTTIDNFQYGLFIENKPEEIMLHPRAHYWTHAYDDSKLLGPLGRSYLKKHLTNESPTIQPGINPGDLELVHRMELSAAINDPNLSVEYNDDENIHLTRYQINGQDYGFTSNLLATVASKKNCPLTGQELPAETLVAAKNKFRTLESLGVIHQLPIVIQKKVDKADHRSTELAIKKFEDLMTIKGESVDEYKEMHPYQMQFIINSLTDDVSLKGLTKEHCYATFVQVMLQNL